MFDEIKRQFNGEITLKLQVILFLINGILLAVLDLGLLFVLTDLVRIDYLISAPISFIVATVVNYSMSRKLIFKPGQYRVSLEFNLFLLFAVLGLIVNEVVLWFFTDFVGLHYMASKVISVLILMVFNFFTRRSIVFRKKQTPSKVAEIHG